MENNTEYQSMVQRELMILRAKKEAADVFRKEEVARERAEREEQLKIELEEKKHKADGMLDVWSVEMRTYYKEHLDNNRDEYYRVFKTILGIVNYYYNDAELQTITPLEFSEASYVPLPQKIVELDTVHSRQYIIRGRKHQKA